MHWAPDLSGNYQGRTYIQDFRRYHNGKEIATDDLDYEMTLETKDIENNLKECYYSLTVNKALHGHTGEYKIFAKNKYGEMETAVSFFQLNLIIYYELTYH